MQKIFRTSFDVPKFPVSLTHQQECILLGSCFAENIGAKLKYFEFKPKINPLGIFYDPFSLALVLDRILKNENFEIVELQADDDIFFHWLVHSKFNRIDKQEMIKEIRSAFADLSSSISKSSYIFISLGQAIHFKHKEAGQAVANCHKQTINKFDKIIPSYDTVKQILFQIVENLSVLNPNLNIIFTLSPVRHVRYGITSNSTGKALLRTAIHEVLNEKDHCFYFPAYEILMDDLRDYRFYAEDLVHPNQTAINYLWEKFSHSIFDTNTLDINSQIHKIKNMINHKPLHPDSKKHQRFQGKIKEALRKFNNAYPNIPLTS